MHQLPRLQIVAVILAGTVAGLPAPSSANLLVNGDFEADPFDLDWINPSFNDGTRAEPMTGFAPGSTTAAFLPRGGLPVLRQTLPMTTAPEWEFSFTFASAQALTDDWRSLMIRLWHRVPETDQGELLRLSVTGDGAVNALRRVQGPGWEQIPILPAGTIEFSTPVDHDLSHPDAVLVPFRVQISGNYTSQSPSYSVLLENIAAGTSHVAENVRIWWWREPDQWTGRPGIEVVDFYASHAAAAIDDVRLISILPGDANRDGRVDGEDFLIWQANFGRSEGATWGEGDFNGDGRVDGEDFLLWQANFGGNAGSAIAPEPAALSLLLLAGAGLCARQRVSRQA